MSACFSCLRVLKSMPMLMALEMTSKVLSGFGYRLTCYVAVVVVPVLVCWPLMAMLANLSFVADSRYALIYLPFLVIDMVVSSLLISMGMMMLPPVFVSLPFKLPLFVVADGWMLVAGSLLYGVTAAGGG